MYTSDDPQAVSHAHLPLEMLSRIFYLYANDLTVSPKESLKWLAVTLVCRHWRDAALGDPHLWTLIFPGTPFHLFAMRAGALPLRIIYNKIRRPHSSEITAVFSQISRVKILKLAADDWHVHATMHSFKRQLSLASMLQLKIENYSSTRGEVNFFLPTCWDNAVDVNLKHLTIFRYHIPWGSPLFSPSLVHLKISHGFCFDMSLCLSTLARLSSLKILTIEATFEEINIRDIIPIPRSHFLTRDPVDLPLLSELTLVGGYLECAQFLLHLQTHSIEHIVVECSKAWNDIIHPPYPEEYLVIAMDHILRQKQVPIQSLRLTAHHENLNLRCGSQDCTETTSNVRRRLELNCWIENIPHLSSETSPLIPRPLLTTVLEHSGREEEQRPLPLLDYLAQEMQLSHVCSTHICFCIAYSYPRECADLFSCMPLLLEENAS